ncbi:DOMON domain-containing protein frrs1l [Goodea atripinnis]|uniref:DOMON domain-containing protein frrs1l n=1 Tax=Goodea atripinnis TaxID=208336 RepID=A0ABV0NUR9_9TELE
MVLLRGFVQLTVLLIQSGWWGVAPSPTDEGALRTGHGDHGEPGHQEPHKDSYSTFASEYGKPGCDAETCDYFLSYRRIGTDVEFEMSADTDGWVAVGFSSDKKMGGDDVMGCVHDDNGRVRIHHFYNVGQWAKEIKRNPARDEEGIFENNRVTCRFKRPLYVPREETLVDLHLSWYYLFAWGPAIQGKSEDQIINLPLLKRISSVICSHCTNRFHHEA